MALTIKRIEAATAGRHSDGGGLYLRVAPGGSKQWVLRIQYRGKRHDIGMGGYPYTTLDDARERAFEARRLARRGGDPLAFVRASEQPEIPMFGAAAQDAYNALHTAWRESYARQFMPTIRQHATALLGLPVDAIDRQRVLDVLKAASGSARDKARRTMAQVFDYLTAYAIIDESPMPTNGELRAVMNTKRETTSHAAMPAADVPAFYRGLPDSPAGAALRFAILTAARVSEAVGAQWSEIDTEAAVWTIPAARMKAGRDHVVPLSTEALRVLDTMPRKAHVFPSTRGTGPVSDESLRRLTRPAGVTVHGFRSTFATWAAQASGGNAPKHVWQAAIAHRTENQTDAAYQRSTFLEERRRLAAKWSAFLLGA